MKAQLASPVTGSTDHAWTPGATGKVAVHQHCGGTAFPPREGHSLRKGHTPVPAETLTTQRIVTISLHISSSVFCITNIPAL